MLVGNWLRMLTSSKSLIVVCFPDDILKIVCTIKFEICYRCATQSKFKICTESEHIPISAILEAQGSYLPLWANTLVLLGFLLVFRILGYIVLRYFKAPK